MSRPSDGSQLVFYPIQTPLRRAYLKCSKSSGEAYVNVRELKKELKNILSGTVTEERLIALLVANDGVYDIKVREVSAGIRARGCVRFRNLKVGELMVLPKSPAHREGQREYI